MDAKGSKPKVYQCFQFETPVDMFEDGTVKPSETFRGLLNAECAKRNVTTKNVIFTIASNAIASRVVLIPFVKEKKIAEILSAGMDDYFRWIFLCTRHLGKYWKLFQERTNRKNIALM
jgi:Tfp pilus assembly PilM family ATPase